LYVIEINEVFEIPDNVFDLENAKLNNCLIILIKLNTYNNVDFSVI